MAEVAASVVGSIAQQWAACWFEAGLVVIGTAFRRRPAAVGCYKAVLEKLHYSELLEYAGSARQIRQGSQGSASDRPSSNSQWSARFPATGSRLQLGDLTSRCIVGEAAWTAGRLCAT